MKEFLFFDTSVDIYQSTRRKTPENLNILCSSKYIICMFYVTAWPRTQTQNNMFASYDESSGQCLV